MGKVFAVLFMTAFILSPQIALAQYVAPRVQPQPPQQLLVQKQVQNPQTREFKNAIAAGEFTFLPDRELVFKVEVKNNTSGSLSNISVKDKIPEALEFVSGPGAFDAATRTLNLTIDKLKPQETRFIEFKAKVKSADKLSGVTFPMCMDNFAEARVNQLAGQGTASFCIGNKILAPVSELPKTGTEGTALVYIGSTMFLATSAYLFKKALARS